MVKEDESDLEQLYKWWLRQPRGKELKKILKYERKKLTHKLVGAEAMGIERSFRRKKPIFHQNRLPKLSRQAVIKVLEAINDGKINDIRPSRKYCLVYQGRHYPPKFVISKACLIEYGHELSPNRFSGGKETNDFLESLGFTIVYCGCGGREGHPSPRVRRRIKETGQHIPEKLTMERLNWSDWIRLETLNRTATPTHPGVYQIRWAIDGKSQLIHRADGVDECGLLYIGKSNNLRSRIWSFWRNIKTGKQLHSGAITYVMYNYGTKFQLDQLEVRWVVLHRDQISYVERNLLKDYIEKYLDTPPLNISIGRQIT